MATLWTVGHSTRTHDELFGILRDAEIETLVDIRSYPSSKYCPQWNQSEIISGMPDEVSYIHMLDLGGKRKALPREESLNNGWKNASFRGYADYMQTNEFQQGLDRLVQTASERRVAFMCSEAVWWKCHRSLVSDALVDQGHTVVHLMGTSDGEHKIRDFATHDLLGRLVYPSA